MGAPKCDRDEFIALFKTLGPAGTARILDTRVRGIYARRDRIEKDLGIRLEGPTVKRPASHPIRAAQRLRHKLRDGVVLVASDAHYWPGAPSTAHRALIALCKQYKPSLVVMNGDVMDGARISRHARIGWDERPTLQDEIEVCKERLDEIRKASPKDCKFVWPLGNHDARFETMLANSVPEYAKVYGTTLKDHFPWWEPCWSVWINDDVVIKHRFKGGIHATHNNTLWAGKTMITGHLHSMKVTPFSDYNGTRWGIDTGTLMDPYDDQTADYTEDNSVNWRSGFIFLTFEDGDLRWPEVVHVIDEDRVDFRGRTIDVG